LFSNIIHETKNLAQDEPKMSCIVSELNKLLTHEIISTMGEWINPWRLSWKRNAIDWEAELVQNSNKLLLSASPMQDQPDTGYGNQIIRRDSAATADVECCQIYVQATNLQQHIT
jgi:hypothetical protein